MRAEISGRGRPSSEGAARPSSEGAGNAGRPVRTRGLVCVEKTHEVVTTGAPGPHGIPVAAFLTVSFALFPVIGLSCHRHPRDAERVFASLTPASRRQNHTTSPS